MNALTQDQLENYISLYGEKTVEAIQNLPEQRLTWVVYNANMVQTAVELIIDLRGEDFYYDYVQVMSCERGEDNWGPLYFDPHVFKLLGNGYD